MKRTAVINVVGLTESLIGEATPHLRRFKDDGSLARVAPAFPAVTCTAQADYLTGFTAARHGIVGNGWFDRALAEVHFWKQSNRLVTAPKLWEELRRIEPQFTCAQLFWWFNMYSSADWSVTPRPMYPADGRKVFDIYAWPYELRPALKRDLGEFPFFGFWGPAAGVDSPQGRADGVSRWIAAAARWIEERYTPTLNLVYLPHLDYNLQRLGPHVATSTLPKSSSGDSPRLIVNPAVQRDLREIDVIVGELLAFFRSRGVRVVILSEYGLTNVSTPLYLNRLFRRHGWLAVKEELGHEILDAGASRVFAVADHQVAHIYLNDPSLANPVRSLVQAQAGVAELLGPEEKRARGVEHPRAGDFIAVAQPDAWFSYYYWFDDAVAPDFARTVDIHRKPGYDPVELFLDPALRFPKLRIARRLLQKRLGFRMLMDVVPLDPTLVRGSHGAKLDNPALWPVFLTDTPSVVPEKELVSTAVYSVLRRLLLE